MYRQYENPYTLEHLLYDAETALANALTYNPDDVDLLLTLHNEVEDLKARVNHAWMDMEYDMEEPQ